MNIIQSSFFVILASVCKLVICNCGEAPPEPQVAACCTADPSDPLVYLPDDHNLDCKKNLSEIRFWCPKGVLPDPGNMKLKRAKDLGCYKA
ncbi:hypothetical protein Pst134EA_009507 [Puccinia striiformis f. sp. tritici]|uniref:hypothetical protein n=1 Tax=Puccinia striiformis f. sp. tritici TaxID=168172 RepID=UPI0020079626|nr:hypothetical protein Pst134EA_009507 [Puccinia striiformis f. sp. tritici]KAH9468985.1 hypothetical protein Pst134EA_009507 [Puccinia striiformis f. sp. tritici]